MRASIIDYPREDLASDIWENSDDGPVLKEAIADEVEDMVYSFLDDAGIPEEALVDLLIYGSILSNQYNSKTDVDARIVLDPEIIEETFGEITGDDLYEMGKELIHDILLGGTKHPFNATVVIEGEDTILGESELGELEETPVYSVLTSTFLVDPYFTDSDFEPDESLAENSEDAKDEMQVLDALLTELKSDVIDYDWVQEAVDGVADKEKFMEKLESKLEEIGADSLALVVEYTDIRDARYETGKEHADPGNVLYKLLEKYEYVEKLKKLKSIVEDGFTKSDLPKIEEVIGVEDD